MIILRRFLVEDHSLHGTPVTNPTLTEDEDLQKEACKFKFDDDFMLIQNNTRPIF